MNFRQKGGGITPPRVSCKAKLCWRKLHLGKRVADDDRIKIVCKRSETIDASVRRLIVK